MKLFKNLALMTAFWIVGLVAFSQCPTAPNGVYVSLPDDVILGTVQQGYTDVPICFSNTTSELLTAVQFKVWYDQAAFNGTTPLVTAINTSFPSYVQSYLGTNSITITLTYTGNNQLFTLPVGQLINIRLFHTANFQNFTSITDFSFTGAPTYTNLSTTNAGFDYVLNTHNSPASVIYPQFAFNGTFTNVTGTGAQGITVGLFKKLNSGLTWEQIASTETNIDGAFGFNVTLDTTAFDVRIEVHGDTMSIGNEVSVADAQKINRFVTGQDQPLGFDFYSSDVNGSGNITISDAYGVFGRMSGRFAEWPNSVNDVKFFTTNEYQTIIGTPTTNFQSLIPGQNAITYNITTASTITFYVLAVGDANATGYNMAYVTPIEIINPNNAPNYIIDQTVEYYADLDRIEINLPRLNVDEGSLVNIPVRVLTANHDLGAMQVRLKYDQDLLEFKGLVSTEKSSKWISFLNPNDGQVEWGGYDASNENLIGDNSMVITLQFLAKAPKPEWTTSPLYVTKKFVGDEKARDLAINPTEGRVEVRATQAANVALGETVLMLYPNPTDGSMTVHFTVPTNGETQLAIYNSSGELLTKVFGPTVMPKGEYAYQADLKGFDSGVYFAVLENEGAKYTTRAIIY